jgi:spore maturation protein SpmA/spore maturation protein SpmB
MNVVFVALVVAAFGTAAWHQASGVGTAMEALSAAILAAAEGAVPLAFGLIGIMALFLGLMKVAEAGGLVDGLARVLTPPLRRLFPTLPPGHPAIGAMAMNVSANLLGLGNAATPFGIRAMEELQSLNSRKTIASNAQVMFLALNTAGITLLPTKVIALRASLGAADPAAITAPTLLATLAATAAAIVAARTLERLSPAPPMTTPPDAVALAPSRWTGLGTIAVLMAVTVALLSAGRAIGPWLVPSLVTFMLVYGWLRRIRVYEVFVEGAREGFTIAIHIIPYLVAIVVAIAMLRQSGALDFVLAPLGRWVEPLGVPPQAVALAVVRTLSGSGAYGMLASLLHDPATGPDTPAGILLSTIYATTETTFYVIAVYFGAVGIRRVRHAVAAGLIADAVGLMAAVVACRVLY